MLTDNVHLVVPIIN